MYTNEICVIYEDLQGSHHSVICGLSKIVHTYPPQLKPQIYILFSVRLQIISTWWVHSLQHVGVFKLYIEMIVKISPETVLVMIEKLDQVGGVWAGTTDDKIGNSGGDVTSCIWPGAITGDSDTSWYLL